MIGKGINGDEGVMKSDPYSIFHALHMYCGGLMKRVYGSDFITPCERRTM